MQIINIKVENKKAYLVDPAAIICGNSDYTVVFEFDEEWKDQEVKTARFYNGKYIDVVFMGDRCVAPIMSNVTGVYIGVYSGDLQTSTPAYVPCSKSILCLGGVHASPSDDVFNQLIAILNQIRIEKGIPSDALPLMNGEAGAGESKEYSRADHVHPTDDTRASNEALNKAISEEAAARKETDEILSGEIATAKEAAQEAVKKVDTLDEIAAEALNLSNISFEYAKRAEEAAGAIASEKAAAEVAVETERARAAEQANAAAIAAETERAKAAEGANAAAIAAETERATAAEGANAAAIAAETARAKAAEEALEAAIAEEAAAAITEETERAKAAEKALADTKQDKLVFDGTYNPESNKAATVETVMRKVAEIIANAPEDFDTLKELADWLTTHGGEAAKMNSDIKANADAIAAETERATAAEEALEAAIAEEAAAAIAAETERATAAEEANAAAIKTETERATAAEEANAAAIAAETARAKAAEEANAAAIAAETERATAAEGANAAAIAAETERATAAEGANAAAIAAETARAKAAEEANATAIAEEATRATEAEEANAAAIAAETARAKAAEEANATAIAEEATRATEAEEAIRGEIINPDYNENDTTKKSHILNRPFYEDESQAVEYTVETRDIDAEPYFIKVGHATVLPKIGLATSEITSLADFLGYTLTYKVTDTSSGSAVVTEYTKLVSELAQSFNISGGYDFDHLMFLITDYIAFNSEYGTSLPSNGIYLAKYEKDFEQSYTNSYEAISIKTSGVVKLDNKYLDLEGHELIKSLKAKVDNLINVTEVAM